MRKLVWTTLAYFLISTDLDAQSPWIKAVFPIHSEYDQEINLVTSDNFILRTNVLGEEIASEPLPGNIGEVTLENKNVRGFSAMENGNIVFFENYEDPEPLKTKSTGKFLNWESYSSKRVILGNGNKIIIEQLPSGASTSFELPGQVISAAPAGNRGEYLWVSYLDGQKPKTVLFPLQSPETRLSLPGKNHIVHSEIHYRKASYGPEVSYSISLVGKEGSYDSIRFISAIYSFTQKTGSSLVPKEPIGIKTYKLPSAGSYKLVSTHGYQAVLKDAKGQFWLLDLTSGIKPLKAMGTASVVAASMSVDYKVVLLAASDNKIYWYNIEQSKISRITDLNKLKAKRDASSGKTEIVYAMAIPKGEYKLEIQPSAKVSDFYAAVFSSDSNEDPARYSAYGDIDADGKMDLVISYLVNPYFDIFFGDAKGGFDRKARVQVPSGNKGSLVKVADINKDNYTDLLVLNPGTGKLSMYLYTKDQTYQVNELPNEAVTYFELYDYNFDYFKDIIISTSGKNYLLLNRGDAAFAPYEMENVPTENAGMDDLDGDKIIDFVKITYGESGDTFGLYMGIEIQYMLSPDKLKHQYINRPTRTRRFDLESNAGSVKTGDFNGDGWIDLVVGYQKVEKLSFFLNNKDGETFTKVDAPAVANKYFPISVWDFDKDGRAEVAMMDTFEPKIYGMDGNGNISCEFCSSQDFRGGLMSVNPFWDLNDDGHMDFLSLSVSNAGYINMKHTCGSDHCFGLSTYLGSGEGGKFKLQDKGKEILFKTIVTHKPVNSSSSSSYSSSSYVPEHERICKTCKGDGFLVDPTGPCYCVSSGLQGSTVQASRCGWCSGSGSFTTYSTNNIGKTVSSSRSCPKCAGGMKSYGGGGKYSCSACGNSGVRTYRGKYRCSECRGTGINIFDY